MWLFDFSQLDVPSDGRFYVPKDFIHYRYMSEHDVSLLKKKCVGLFDLSW